MIDHHNFNLADHYKGNLEWFVDRTIFLTRHGSQAYGTSTPTSDLDIKGVVVPPRSIYLSMFKSFEQVEIMSPEVDLVAYQIGKFMKLAADCNPNIIEILFTDPEDWIHVTPAWTLLHEHRQAFLSKKARHTFHGYAVAQLKRIRSHKAWLLNPPTHKPTREEFGLDTKQALSDSEMGAFDSLQSLDHSFGPELLTILQKEKEYKNAVMRWGQFQKWQKERNPKRHALEADFGYDTKHAMHLVRLLRMATEILSTGQVNVRRPDAQELLAIRKGAWTYEHLMEWVDKAETEIQDLYETSTLPKSSDMEFLDTLHQRVVELAWASF